MFFCAGRAIGAHLGDPDDSDSEWDSDTFYHHQPFSAMHHHHHGDADSKISKMGSLMFVVRSAPLYLFKKFLFRILEEEEGCESLSVSSKARQSEVIGRRYAARQSVGSSR